MTPGPSSADPPSAVWAALGLTPEAEMHTGHQSKVFLTTGPEGPLVAKLVEARHAGPASRQRVEVARRLAEINPDVVGPVDIGSGLVVEIDR